MGNILGSSYYLCKSCRNLTLHEIKEGDKESDSLIRTCEVCEWKRSHSFSEMPADFVITPHNNQKSGFHFST